MSTQLARTISKELRETDFVARCGGEEFPVLASHTDLAEAAKLGERLRESIASTHLILDSGMSKIAASCEVPAPER